MCGLSGFDATGTSVYGILGLSVLPNPRSSAGRFKNMAINHQVQEFLRTRRARLQPEDVGIPATGRRRVAGLRREEVAMLAGVSLDYYARLEQGRDLQPSDQVLDAIARALRLAEVERLYLHNVVRSTAVAPPLKDLELAPLDAGMRTMLDSLQTPAFVIDIRGDVHWMNRMGCALLDGLGPMPSKTSNHTLWLFCDQSTRTLFTDWEMNARASVGTLRDAAGRYPHDPRLQALVGELSVASPEFRSWWAEHDVDTRCRGLKRFQHPIVGELAVQTEALQLLDGNRWLYAYAPEPGTRSEQGLQLLGSWAATQAAAVTADQPRPVNVDVHIDQHLRGGDVAFVPDVGDPVADEVSGRPGIAAACP
jgi:transcriptional regulator with XRE-family HTH domain